jgi:ABC-2 type transport system ATP-binding protein
VSDVSFSAERGEILGFLGPNGAGKTTTMRMLTCYLPPTAGQARVAGYDIHEQSLEVRRHIGYLPETVPLYLDLSVARYLDFVGRLKGMPRPSRADRIRQVMQECGIEHVRERTVGKLSKGYRQRVGLAQALLNDPEVLILDEPTVGLDPQQIVEIRDLIRNLAGKRTIILSTHILPEVSLLCRRIIIINNGRLISADTPENLKKRLRSAMVLEVTVRGPTDIVTQRLRALPEVSSVRAGEATDDATHCLLVEAVDNQDIRESVSRTIVESGNGLLAQRTVDLSLEDVFVHLVTKEDI